MFIIYIYILLMYLVRFILKDFQPKNLIKVTYPKIKFDLQIH